MKEDDVDLQRTVIDELDWEPSVNAAGIGVTVTGSVVTLSGYVPTYAEKRAAERAVLRVAGVHGVADEIEVRLPSMFERTDAELAKAALDALHWNVYLPEEKIKVKVEDGWITLEGKVEWKYQRDRAEQAVRTLKGVLGVVTLLEIEPRTSPLGVKEKILKALQRIAAEDAEHIQVVAEGGKVTLRGTVRTWMERDEAETAAWSAPGVTEVHNLVDVRKLVYA
jgi:osmotically-inducible protein OsmY